MEASENGRETEKLQTTKASKVRKCGVAVMADPTKANALKCLQRALDSASTVRGLKHANSEFQKWKTLTIQDLKRIFGEESDAFRDFDRSLIIGLNEDSGANVDRAATLLRSRIEEIEEDWPETGQSSDSSNIGQVMPRKGNRVFVVHGHDEAAREKVAGFLRKLDLNPVILQEQPNKGRTIIEKLESNADVSFAVVLLTPDDVGAHKDKATDLQPRARQNVILELGCFIGKIGRERVCALLGEGVEIPSDYHGVLYVPLDNSDGWKMKLLEELKAAGFEIDANRAFQP